MRKTFRWALLWLAAFSGSAPVVGQQAAPQPAQPPGPPGPSAPQVFTSQVWTWDQVNLNNTTVLAGRLNIDELKAQEITAHLRPNPGFTLTADGTQITPSNGKWEPFAGTFISPGVSYLFERRNKRNLRFEAAKQGTAIGVAQQADL